MKTTLLLLALLVPASAYDREFSISGLQCQTVTCEAREGIMPHRLTTIEVSGKAAAYAGYSLTLRLVNRRDNSVVFERKTGVMVDGGFTASLPAYNLPDGQYAFVFASPGQVPKAVAGGVFTIGPVGAPAAAPAAPAAPAGGLSGHWLGIAGTAADVTIKPDGTYVSGGTATGTWRQQGSDVYFTGPLAAWNGGHGKLKPSGDVIEFYWTNAAGAKQYFVLAKH